MINTDRVVPITKIDLISMYGFVLKQSVSTLAKVDAENPEGEFDISAADTPLIASEPVKSVNFASDVSSATLYFVPGYNYEGFSLDGAAVTTTGDAVDSDGISLYSATLSSGAVTIAKVGF